MQNIADQVSEVWNDRFAAEPSAPSGAETITRSCIAARDFMVLRIPSHELDSGEREELRTARQEAQEVMRSWADHAGAWVQEGSARRWVGLDGAPATEYIEVST